MKISTSGPAIDAGTVNITDSEALCGYAAVEAINLAAQHLQSKVTADQGPDTALCFLAMAIDWVAAEHGVPPPAAVFSAMALLDPQHPKGQRVDWVEPKPTLELP